MCAWSGGTYTKGNNSTGGWTGDASLGIGIEAGRHDTQDDDFATGINACLTKDGTNSPSANLPMGGYKHTGVANASSNDEYTTQGQLKNNSFTAELEALEVAPTSADTAIDVTAKSGATGALVTIKDNSSNEIFYVGNNGFAGVNTTSGIFGAANPVEVRTTSGSGDCIVSNFSVLGDGEAATFTAATNVGGSVRVSQLGMGKHAGIARGCAYLVLETESGSNNHTWYDNSNILRVSSTFTHIGTTSGTVIGTQTSDERLKEIEPDFDYGLEQVKALKPIAYVRKDDPDQKRRIGFGAQTTKPIVPEAVYDTKEEIEGEDPAETKLAMDYTSIIPVLVKAIQELEAKVASLEAQVAGT